MVLFSFEFMMYVVTSGTKRYKQLRSTSSTTLIAKGSTDTYDAKLVLDYINLYLIPFVAIYSLK